MLSAKSHQQTDLEILSANIRSRHLDHHRFGQRQVGYSALGDWKGVDLHWQLAEELEMVNFAVK